MEHAGTPSKVLYGRCKDPRKYLDFGISNPHGVCQRVATRTQSGGGELVVSHTHKEGCLPYALLAQKDDLVLGQRPQKRHVYSFLI